MTRDARPRRVGRREARRSGVAKSLVVVAIAAAFAVAFASVLGLSCWARRDVSRGVAELRSPDVVAWSSTAGASAPSEHTGNDVRRTAVLAEDASSAAASFEAMFDALVELHVDAHARVDEWSEREAAELDRRFTEGLDEVVVTFDDAHERAWYVLASLETPFAAAPRRIAAARVAEHLIGLSLARSAVAGDRRDRIMAFVEGMLGTFAASGDLAEAVTRVLESGDHLGPTCEPLLVRVLLDDGLDASVRRLAERLLLVLWRRLGAAGDESVGDLLGWFEGDGPMRSVAARRLVLDPRFRDLVVADAVRAGDAERIRELGVALVQGVPFAEAIEPLARMESALEGWSVATPYLLLGDSAPKKLQEHYEEVLAEGARPRHRRAVVAGLTASNERSIALATARLAVEQDPDPGIRSVAALALGRLVDGPEFERHAHALLADPAFASDPDHLALLVFGLEALAARGFPNVVDRLGRRLADCPLYPNSRRDVERLRSAYVPGGRAR
jgi:hypothetical protein